MTGFQRTGALISTAVTEMVTAVDVSGIWQAVESSLESVAEPVHLPDESARPALDLPWREDAVTVKGGGPVRRLVDRIVAGMDPGRLAWAGVAASAAALAVFLLFPGQGTIQSTRADRTVAVASSTRLDYLSGAPGYTVSSWVQPRTKARVIWVDNQATEFAARDVGY